MPDGGRVAHHDGHRGIIELFILELADNCGVDICAPCYIAHAQTRMLALLFHRLQRPLDVKLHSHGHDRVRIALAGAEIVASKAWKTSASTYPVQSEGELRCIAAAPRYQGGGA